MMEKQKGVTMITILDKRKGREYDGETKEGREYDNKRKRKGAREYGGGKEAEDATMTTRDKSKGHEHEHEHDGDLV